MKVLGICGSPRKKATYFMIKTALDAAKEKGAEAEIISLADIEIAHCKGCAACEKTGKCVISDGMEKLIEKIESADALVIGSPSYYDNVTGTMKDFIDRGHPLWNKGTQKGKKVGICCTGHLNNIAEIRKCTDVLANFAGIIEMDIVGTVTANNMHLESKAVVAELEKLGEKIAGK